MNFWDFEAWSFVLQMGFLSIILLVANTLVRKVKFFKNSLMPVAVLGGFIALIIRLTGICDSFLDDGFLNIITYQALMIGFIALGLKVKKEGEAKASAKPLDSGMFIVSCYVLQGIIGIGLAFFLIPKFAASGLLLTMGFGQGPGQANNIGMQFEMQGFVGGQAFGLSIASIGFLWACVLGVIYLNVLKRKGKITTVAAEDVVTEDNRVTDFEDIGEIPVSNAIDKFSIQIAFVLMTAVFSYLAMFLFTKAFELTIGGAFVENTVKPLVWGFNFIFGMLVAMLVSKVMKALKKFNIMKRQYPNNYMLNRITGCAFDYMIIASITVIDIAALKELVLPLLIITTAGGIATFIYVKYMAKYIYPNYALEATLGFYGMMTGTMSSGMILIREVDPTFKTPAADALVLGSGTGVLFGFPLLMLVGLAPKEPLLTFGLIILLFVIFEVALLRKLIFKKRNKGEKTL
ncbi:MAG: sodium:glutamate symporter [Clostridia bacterium]